MGWSKRYGYSSKGNQTFTNNIFEKQNKYHNKKSTFEGIEFDSLTELNDYKKLCEFKKLGYIEEIKAHPDGITIIDPAIIEVEEKTVKGIYKKKKVTLFNGTVFNPDFELKLNDGKIVYLDTKSYATISDAYKIKVKLLYQKYGKLCITAFPEYMNNLSVVLKAVSAGCFKQYWNKNSSADYIKDLLNGKFKI